MAMNSAIWLDDEIANTLDVLIGLEEKGDPQQVQVQQDRLDDLLSKVSVEKENIERIAGELDFFLKSFRVPPVEN